MIRPHNRRLCLSGQLSCDARIIFRVGERTCGGPGTTRAVSCGVSVNNWSVIRARAALPIAALEAVGA